MKLKLTVRPRNHSSAPCFDISHPGSKRTSAAWQILASSRYPTPQLVRKLDWRTHLRPETLSCFLPHKTVICLTSDIRGGIITV